MTSNVRSMQQQNIILDTGAAYDDEVKINSLATISKGMFGEQKEQNLMKKTPCQLLKMGVDLSYFGLVLQPVAQERMDSTKQLHVFEAQKKEKLKLKRGQLLNIPLNTSRHTS